jgi:hypothetical protein
MSPLGFCYHLGMGFDDHKVTPQDEVYSDVFEEVGITILTIE